MLFVTLDLGLLLISWQNISVEDIQGLNGVSPSIDGLLKMFNWNINNTIQIEISFKSIYPVRAKFVIIFTIRMIVWKAVLFLLSKRLSYEPNWSKIWQLRYEKFRKSTFKDENSKFIYLLEHIAYFLWMSSSFIIHIEYNSYGIHWIIYWESDEKQESKYMYS